MWFFAAVIVLIVALLCGVAWYELETVGYSTGAWQARFGWTSVALLFAALVLLLRAIGWP